MHEQEKYNVIKSLAEHSTSNKHRAAMKLGCTVRHINRMLKGYKEQGKAFFIHGNRGRKPANTISDEIRSQVVELYQQKYNNANFEHFTELLGKHENIHISSSATTSILETEYIFSPKITRAKKKRIRKELEAKKKVASTQKEKDKTQIKLVALEDAHPRHPRAAYFGELLQMDASAYQWIPGQIWHLHIAIDDASGRIVGCYFDTQETLNAYYQVFHQILTTYGIPYQFLTDRRTIFTYKKKNSPSIDKDTYTQFAYACKQLGVDLASTSVPQAKGRVERLNQTLQSRLPIELRLAGIKTMEDANEFLLSYKNEFNEKFSLPLNCITSTFEEPPENEKLNLILAVLCERIVDAGHCLRHSKHYYRMLDANGQHIHCKPGTKVLLIKAFDGSLYCSVSDKDIYALEEVPEHMAKSKNLDPDHVSEKPSKKYIPPMNHPWKRQSFERFVRSQKHHANDEPETAYIRAGTVEGRTVTQGY